MAFKVCVVVLSGIPIVNEDGGSGLLTFSTLDSQTLGIDIGSLEAIAIITVVAVAEGSRGVEESV